MIRSAKPLSNVKYHGCLKIEPHPALTDFCAKTGIKAGFAAGEFGFGSFLGFAVPPEDRERLAKLTSNELSIYPKDVLDRSRLRRVVLCSGLQTTQGSWGGFCVPLRKTIFFDSAALSSSEDYARKSIHHELYHLIDFYDDLLMYLDPVWTRLNRNEFKYFGRATNKWSEDVFPGFVSDYARNNVCEDKAETYSYLIISANSLLERAKHDAVLRAKVERMKKLMRAFSPHFDEAFWSACLDRSLERQRAGANVSEQTRKELLFVVAMLSLIFLLIAIWMSVGR